MKLETFSYLPQLSSDEAATQIEDLLAAGLIPGIEFTSEPGPRNTYWNMWGLPLFLAQTARDVTAQIDACAAQNPRAYVRVIGYDRSRGGIARAFVVRRPPA